MAPVVQRKLKNLRGVAACPKCGYSGEIKVIQRSKTETGIMFVCHYCNYEG